MDGWCGETGPNWWPLAKITICQKEQAEHQGVPFQSEFQSERTKTFPADLSWAPRAHLLKLASCADSRINRMRSAARRPVWLNARVKRKLPFSNSFFLLHLHLGSRRRNERREGCKECSLLPASRAQNNNSQAAAKDAIHVHRNLYIYLLHAASRSSFFAWNMRCPWISAWKIILAALLCLCLRARRGCFILNVTTLHVLYIHTWLLVGIMIVSL